MKIQELFDIDRFIKTNDILEVTSQQILSSQNNYNPNGLFSENIFGQTPEERKYRCGYITLPVYFFNPYIAKNVIKSNGGNIRKLAYSEARFNLVDGELIQDEKGKYSGFKDLYQIWDQIDIKKTVKSQIPEIIDILTKTPKRLLFSNKVLVLPPDGFREMGTKNGKQVKSELNTLYMKLLGLKSVSSHIGSTPHKIHNQIQDTIMDIYVFIDSRVSKKHGFFQKELLSKTTLWGASAVISAPKYNTENPEIGVFRTGYPLAILTSLFHPLVKFQLKQMLSYDSIYQMHVNKEEVRSNDIVNMYDDKMIEDLMKIYKKNPGNRFKQLYLDPANTKPIMIQYMDLNKNEPITRPLTLTDIIYQCVYTVVVVGNRMVYTVRYPIGDYLGAFFSKVHILSTNTTTKIQMGEQVYPSYPLINIELPRSRVATSFSETVTPSNSRLKVIGGDYDGDTVKNIGIWSDDANKQAEELMYSKIYNITPQGTTVYQIEIECLNGLFALTKNT